MSNSIQLNSDIYYLEAINYGKKYDLHMNMKSLWWNHSFCHLIIPFLVQLHLIEKWM